MTQGKSIEGEVIPPHIPMELLDFLRSVFRNELPPISTTDRELGRMIGRQDVIRELEVHHENQKEAALDVPT